MKYIMHKKYNNKNKKLHVEVSIMFTTFVIYDEADAVFLVPLSLMRFVTT